MARNQSRYEEFGEAAAHAPNCSQLFRGMMDGTPSASDLLELIENANQVCFVCFSDYLFKVLMIGNSGVGKSCLLLRFADDQF
jgi:transcriptional regulator with AAA-type ATPase domain